MTPDKMHVGTSEDGTRLDLSHNDGRIGLQKAC